VKSAPIHYRIEAHDPQAHVWRITLTVSKPAKNQIVSLPVWIPGSYLVREFAKHLQQLRATQGGHEVPLSQHDKCTWQAACKTTAPLVLSYEVYAFDMSVRTSYLDAQRGFFNPTSLCLRVHGQESKAHTLELTAPEKVAIQAIYVRAEGRFDAKKQLGEYTFSDYDELADTPFECVLGSAKHWHGSFDLRGVRHEMVVTGAAPSFDGARLLADTQKIVEAEFNFWHGPKDAPPYRHYVFMLHTVADGYGGLEHRASTALIASRSDLPRKDAKSQPEGYTQLLGLISHEYFHTWNVKRLKPIEFTRYDYAQENYTRLLWFFEGFTSYYDDLLLRRAGLIDNNQYLRLLQKTLNQVLQTPGRWVQSVADASMDAWVKYYRIDENTPNITVSYYTKGALVGLCLDLTLRREGRTSLDEVMRALFKRCKAGRGNPAQAGGMTEADLLTVLRELGGRSFEAEVQRWTRSTDELPVLELLAAHGVEVRQDAAPLAQRLGLRVQDSSGSVQIKTVLRGSAAHAAGFAANDEWLAVGDWRITKLDELPLLAGTAKAKSKTVTALVARDKRLLSLKLAIPEASSITTAQLKAAQADKVNAWLAG
jgi:predicted metalloprotease with PDZ domain